MPAKPHPLLVKDVVKKHASRQIPVVHCDTPVDGLAESISWFRHSRQLYVVDDDNHLLGNITLHTLVGHVYHHHHGATVQPRHLLKMITAEKAGELMTEQTLSTTADEPVEKVLEEMVARRVEEVPVLDEQGRVVGDMTLIDLMRAL